MIKKFDDFIFEAKSKKEDNTSLLLRLFNDKPTVKTSSKDEKGAYSLSGIKKFFRDNGKTNDQADDAFYQISNDKSVKVGSISVKDYKFDENLPHFYIGLGKEEASKIKEDYEKSGLESNKETIEKKKESKRLQVAAAKEKKVKKSAKSKSKTPTAKSVVKSTKKSTAKKIEKK
mgnify:FL=1